MEEIQGDSYTEPLIFFACNYWKNDGKQMELASEALPVHAGNLFE